MSERMRSVDAEALSLFDAYVDLPAAERAAQLRALQDADPMLHEALLALLQADASSTLDRAPIEAVAAVMQLEPAAIADDQLGRLVGPWRIVGVTGQGGMGSIYRVERNDRQYQQTAALKFVRAEASTPSLVEAFVEERNLLASLRHPGIVPLLDGGVDDDGRPWFVMQYVDGEQIDTYCNRRQLGVRQRVELVVRACDAIRHAHDQGILHQDIKPSNLMVTPDGHPQLLDFGLSIQMRQQGEGAPRRLAMTTGYAAPEVLRGDVPGVGVDLYALGVLLCQLCCGRFRAPGERSLQSTPHPPTELVSYMTPAMLAERGMPDHRTMACALIGGLDSIVLRCLHADPAQRYGSVEALQQDLRNWLTGHPVAAHGSGWVYSAKCFVGRHRGLSVATVVLVIGLGAVGGTWAWQKSRAERDLVASSHVDRVLESVMGAATLSGLGDAPLATAAMLERNEAYFRQPSMAAHPGVVSRGLSVLARNWAAIGEYDRAESLVREAAELARGDHLLTAFNLATLAQVQNLQARHGDAERTAKQGLSLLRVRWSDQHQLASIRLRSHLAAAQSGQARSREAFETLSIAISDAEALPRIMGDAVVAQLLVQRGNWYRWRLRMAESEADLLRALELVGESDAMIADDARESLVRTVRAARGPGREARSLEIAQALLESRQRSLGVRHPSTGMAWTELALMRLLNFDDSGAQDAVDQARAVLEPALGEAHPAYARTLYAQSLISTLAGRIDDAMADAERAIDIYQRALGGTHEFTLEARFLRGSLYWARLSRTQDTQWRDRAISELQSGIDDSLSTHGDVAALHRMGLATLLSSAGRTFEAGEMLATAREDAIRQYGAGSQEALHVRLTQLGIAVDQATDDAWIERESMALIADSARIETLYASSIVHTAWLQRATWLEGKGRIEAARQAVGQAREEAVRAGQQSMIDLADARLRQLDEGRLGVESAGEP